MKHLSHPVRVAAAAAVLATCCSLSPAQCNPAWSLLSVSSPLPLGAVVVKVLPWDMDGPGPLAPVLACGGAFALAGTVAATNVAAFDPVSGQWTALGNQLTSGVNALTVDGANRLIAGGGIASAPGFVEAWTGSSWTSLANTNGSVLALCKLANGDIVAGGSFTVIGGVAAARVARFDGSMWHPMGAGAASSVSDLEVSPSGELFGVGNFVTSTGPAPGDVARWDGVQWRALASSTTTIPFGAVDVDFAGNGDLFAVGIFFDGANVARVGRYGGGGWHTVDAGPDGPTIRIAVHPNGDLVVGGDFDMAGTVAVNNVARWNGATWEALGAGLGAHPVHQVLSLAIMPNGAILAGGAFDTQSVNPGVRNVAIYSSNCLPTLGSVGVGCSGANGGLALASENLAWIGDSARALSGVFSPGSIAFAVWGFDTVSTLLSSATPLALPGCFIWVRPDFVGFMSVTGPVVRTSVAIPNDPGLIGVRLYHQMIAVQTVGGVPTEMISSNAVRFVIGDL